MRKPPPWFRVAAVLLVLWGIAACASYVAHVRFDPDDPANPVYDRELYRSLPAWLTWIYAVAVGTTLAGAVALRRDGRASQVTALVVDADDTPLSLGPIHRVLLDEQGRERVTEHVVTSVLDRCRGAGAVVEPSRGDEAGGTTVVLLHGTRSWTVTWPSSWRSSSSARPRGTGRRRLTWAGPSTWRATMPQA